jgi:hypothetical protein
LGNSGHLSIRQVQRAKAALRKDGKTSVIHGLKGKTGNHRIEETIKDKSLKVIKKKYSDFKPSPEFPTFRVQN